MRIGELLALQVKDVNFEDGTIRVDESLTRLDGEDLITAPKTESSVRVITIHKELQDEIREHISTLYRPKPGTRLFVGRTKSFFEHEMERGIKSSGVKKITVHCTRHSHARLILSNQLSVGYIPICMQILDLSRINWKMGGKNSLYVLFCIDDYLCRRVPANDFCA